MHWRSIWSTLIKPIQSFTLGGKDIKRRAENKHTSTATLSRTWQIQYVIDLWENFARMVLKSICSVCPKHCRDFPDCSKLNKSQIWHYMIEREMLCKAASQRRKGRLNGSYIRATWQQLQYQLFSSKCYWGEPHQFNTQCSTLSSQSFQSTTDKTPQKVKRFWRNFPQKVQGKMLHYWAVTQLVMRRIWHNPLSLWVSTTASALTVFRSSLQIAELWEIKQ